MNYVVEAPRRSSMAGASRRAFFTKVMNKIRNMWTKSGKDPLFEKSDHHLGSSELCFPDFDYERDKALDCFSMSSMDDLVEEDDDGDYYHVAYEDMGKRRRANSPRRRRAFVVPKSDNGKVMNLFTHETRGDMDAPDEMPTRAHHAGGDIQADRQTGSSEIQGPVV